MVRVLIVDDDQAIRETLREALADSGVAAEEAANGLVALATLRDAEPTVVLLDQYMPQMDGMTVLHTIAAEGDLATRHTFLLLTGNPQLTLHTSMQVRPDFVVGVVPKPFDLFELLDRVQQAMDFLATP